jgi:hypothetical protein
MDEIHDKPAYIFELLGEQALTEFRYACMYVLDAVGSKPDRTMSVIFEPNV